MKQFLFRVKPVLAAVLAVAVLCFAVPARADDLPVTAQSPLTGVSFDDKPMVMPEQRNFQMAMISASGELGLNCGKMETYAWRMSQNEQARVNQIYNNTVDRLRLLGYTITPQALKSVSRDITLFTVERQDKHFIFLWSAGDAGLVLNLCETAKPALASKPANPSVGVFSAPMDTPPSKGAKALSKPVKSGGSDSFSPVGEWEGYYIGHSVYTGASMKINRLRGQNFDGVLKFFPTPKNPNAPTGSYEISGQYDRETKHILINPGRWLKHPTGYVNTIMVGTFDPARNEFSAYFEGVSGCTSFEARREGPVVTAREAKKSAPKKPKAAKKAKPAAAPSSNSYIPTMESIPLSATDPVAKPDAAESMDGAGGTIVPLDGSITLDGVAPAPSPEKK